MTIWAAALGSLLLAGTAWADERAPITEHVILVSIDGLRPDAIEAFDAPNLQRLVREGSASFEATTILPSKTLPSHTSMLTGAEPETHGVTWNTPEMDTHGHVSTPTIFAAAKQAGLHTAAFFSKQKFEHLAVPGTLDFSLAPSSWPGFWRARRTVNGAERYLTEEAPNLLFVHIGEPDYAGHSFGWMSARYGRAVRSADTHLGQLLSAADAALGAGSYTLVVTSDHGGHDRTHGSDDPRDVTIPWIAWGQGVSAGSTLPSGIRTMDSAATALWLLGVAPLTDSVGIPIREAFEAADSR